MSQSQQQGEKADSEPPPPCPRGSTRASRMAVGPADHTLGCWPKARPAIDAFDAFDALFQKAHGEARGRACSRPGWLATSPAMSVCSGKANGGAADVAAKCNVQGFKGLPRLLSGGAAIHQV